MDNFNNITETKVIDTSLLIIIQFIDYITDITKRKKYDIASIYYENIKINKKINII